MTIARNGLLAGAAIALSVAFAGSAGAAPLPTATVAAKAATPANVSEVRHRRGHRARVVAPRRHRAAPGYYGYGGPQYGGPDTVGSLGYTPDGYAYNRFSGQRYQTCMLDEGYGRVRPCDAGRL
ncbi:MAG TPA: hypothetical protein VGD36_07400 [Xanthobacteraceae bacterium]|jgi:hypothetical protein